MASVDAAILQEYLEEFLELQDIGRALAVIEQQYGPHEVVEDARRRQRRLCDQLLEQLRHLLCADWCLERVH
jgi:hypothetical protein